MQYNLIYEHQAVSVCDTCDIEQPASAKPSPDDTLIAQDATAPGSAAIAGLEQSAYAPRVISRENAFLISEAMKSAIWGGRGYEGTAASWVGFDDAESILGRSAWNSNLGNNQVSGSESGAKTAMPAWQAFAEAALADVPQNQPATPAGIVSVRIDRATGLLSQTADDSSEFEFFQQGTEPTQYAQPATNNPLDAQKPTEIDIFR